MADAPSLSDQLACLHCGQPIRMGTPGERTPSSAWVSPDADDPVTCIPSAPGHAPTDPPPMVLWLVFDDDRPDLRVSLVAGPAVARTTQSLDTWTAGSRANAAAGWPKAGGRYELRPVDPD